MMHRLVASKQTVMQLLIGSTRACMVAQPAQRFSSIVNVETVSALFLVKRFNFNNRETSQARRRRARRPPVRPQTLRLPALKMLVPTALFRLPPLLIHPFTSPSPLVMSRRSSRPLITSLLPRKIPSQADMPPFSSQPPHKRVLSTMFSRT